MKVAIRVALIFVTHAVFLFWAYGSHFFGLLLPYGLTLLVWLGLSSAVAAYAYDSVLAKLNRERLQIVGTVAATCASLFTGVFFAVNFLGT
jgi:hypothetical protein